MEIQFLKQRKMAGILLGILAAIFSIVEVYLFYPIVTTINSLRFNNIFEGLILMIRFVFKTLLENIHIKVSCICLFVFALLVASLIFSLLFYFIFVETSDFIENKEQDRKKFLCKKFLKTWGAIVLTGCLVTLGSIFFAIVALPSLLVTASYVEGELGLIYCLFFDLVTILTIWSANIYIRIPLWNFIKNIVDDKKQGVSDGKFKQMVITLLVLDIAFIVSRFIMIAIRIKFNSMFSIVCQFLVITMLNIFYLTYKIYNTFRILKNDMLKD